MALLKRKKSGLGDPMSVVTRFVNAANRHDAEGVAGCLHPDFDSIQPMYPSRNFRGADQVRRNWQAIFDAEPGFRLTVLRSVSADNTVWLELHGAGRDAEVAGVFVMGIQGERVRWARIYSALVEPVPEGEGEVVSTSDGTRTPLRDVNQVEAPATPPADAEVDESAIAPVVNLEEGAKTRRRRSSRRRGAAEAPPDEMVVPATVEPEDVAEVEESADEPPAQEAAVVEAPEVDSAEDEVVPAPEPEVELLVEPEAHAEADDTVLADDTVVEKETPS